MFSEFIPSLSLLALPIVWALYADFSVASSGRERIATAILGTDKDNVGSVLSFALAATLGWHGRWWKWFVGPLIYSLFIFFVALFVALMAVGEISIGGLAVSLFVGALFYPIAALPRDVIIVGLLRLVSWVWGSALYILQRQQMWVLGRFAFLMLLFAVFYLPMQWIAVSGSGLSLLLNEAASDLLAEVFPIVDIVQTHEAMLAHFGSASDPRENAHLYAASSAGKTAVAAGTFAAPLGASIFVIGYFVVRLISEVLQRFGAAATSSYMLRLPVTASVVAGGLVLPVLAVFGPGEFLSLF
ncbi:MAG: hypothetical protein RIC14_03440 [Filomicrobium sp.]